MATLERRRTSPTLCKLVSVCQVNTESMDACQWWCISWCVCVCVYATLQACFENQHHHVLLTHYGCRHWRADDGKAALGEGHHHQLALVEPGHFPHSQAAHQIWGNTVQVIKARIVGVALSSYLWYSCVHVWQCILSKSWKTVDT